MVRSPDLAVLVIRRSGSIAVMRQRPPPREDVPPPAKDRDRAPVEAPPTIAFLRAQGVTGMRVYCRTGYCVRSARLAFEAIALPADLPFPAIERSGRLVCSACGGRIVSTMPDWPTRSDGGASANGWMLPP